MRERELERERDRVEMIEMNGDEDGCEAGDKTVSWSLDRG